MGRPGWGGGGGSAGRGSLQLEHPEFADAQVFDTLASPVIADAVPTCMLNLHILSLTAIVFTLTFPGAPAHPPLSMQLRRCRPSMCNAALCVFFSPKHPTSLL